MYFLFQKVFETTIPPVSPGQDHSMQNTLSGLGDIFSVVFRGEISDGCSKTTNGKMKKETCIFYRKIRLFKVDISRWVCTP